MSSSKIEARNLSDSVFDGIAREESVQGVLSKVENIGDLIPPETNGFIMKYNASSLNPSTLLNITGSGKLLAFQISGKTNATSSVTVEIDGKTVLNATISPNGQTDKIGYWILTNHFISHPVSMSDVVMCKPYQSNALSQAYYGVTARWMVYSHISFNQSIKITVTGIASGTGVADIDYILDE